MAIKLNQEIVNQRTNDLIGNFKDYLSNFKEDNPFSGPSEYFYINKIMKTIKTQDYNNIFRVEFIEYVYATLASWGMHRMGPDNKGAKMNDFNSFNQCILDNKDKFIKLSKYNLETANFDENLIKDLDSLFLSLRPLMKSNSKLVATTKVMHFFLPNLVPPMDREYTMKFFNVNLPTIKSESDDKNIQKEIEIFNSILKKMHFICNEVNCKIFIDDSFSPSIPKVLDNAIVGYIRKNK